jgi:hypothetical protein
LHIHRFIIGAGLATIAAIGGPVFAFAQEAPATTVDIAPAVQGVLGYVSAAIGAVVMGAIGIVSARFYSWAGISIEARDREALHSAIMTGVNGALGKISGLIGGRAVDVHSTVLAEALRYVLASVPDAVRRFGLGEDRLREMIAAKLAQIERDNLGFEPATELRSSIAVVGQAG